MNLGRRRNLGRSNIGSREQYRWAGWAALVAIVGAAILAYGCGSDGRGHSDRDRDADTGEVAHSESDARTVATDMDADHSAAWMEALDGLAVVHIRSDMGGDANRTVVAELESVTPTVYVAPPPYAVLDTSVQLTEAQVRQVLTESGWPVELHEEAIDVIWCESSFSPGASNGISYGLFQLVPLWFGYAGESFSGWHNEYLNARVAYQTYLYDLGRGYPAWNQWQCKPWTRPHE